MITKPAVRESLSPFVDFLVVLALAALLFQVAQLAKHWEAPLESQAHINLSLSALPGYVLFSLSRGFIAYGFSLVFAVLYGYTAIHWQHAERLMLPLLDILQSIPVLGFLPGTVLALVAIFPKSNVGLELASILMIFTGQVWNMTFSFYQSVRNIPSPLQEASLVYQFSSWQRFRYVELPASATGLAWNSMMSMAGGWFFLIVCESFKLGSRDFRLPGLGAYMSVAIAEKNIPAILSGAIAMILMIVLIDTFLWKPLVEWAQKFRIEETSPGNKQQSRILSWMRRSWLLRKLRSRILHPISEWFAMHSVKKNWKPKIELKTKFWKVSTFALAFICLGFIGWAILHMGHALNHIARSEWLELANAALLSFLRVTGAVILGSLWTIPVGIWIGQSDRRSRMLQPFVQVAASFPAPMLYPLVLLGLHQLGITLGFGALLLMLLGTQWYILFNVIAGASAVPEELREAAKAYQFTPLQFWRNIWLPAVSPYLITGWVTAAGGAWNASIVAEYVSVGKQMFVAPGLGSLISIAAGQGRYDLLGAGVLTMAIVVVLINRCLWKPLQRLVEMRYGY